MRAGTNTDNSKCWSTAGWNFSPWHPSASLLPAQLCWYHWEQALGGNKSLTTLVKNGCWGSFHPSQSLRGVEAAPLGCPVWRGEGWDGTGRGGRGDPGHLLDAELAHGVIHQHRHVLHGHPDVPVGPAALIWPVLSTFTLWGGENRCR